MKLKCIITKSSALVMFLLIAIGQTSLFAQRPLGQVPNKKGPVQLNLNATAQDQASLEQGDLRNHLNTLVQKGILTQGDTDYFITSEHTSSLSGIHHIYYRQAINGIEVMGTEASIHIAQNGSIKKVHDGSLLKNINTVVKSSAASLTAPQAIQAIASQMDYGVLTNLTEINSKSSNRTKLFTKAGISSTEIPAKEMYYLVPNDGIRMIWEIAIQEVNSSDWWNFRVDASTGTIIDKFNFTVSCNIADGHDHREHSPLSKKDESCDDTALNTTIATHAASTASAIAADGASYNVYAVPIESPYFGTRTDVVDPADPVASPFGWHDTNGVSGAEFTTTRGNNTITVDDIDNNNSGGATANGGTSLVFDFPFDATQTQAGINVPLWNTANRSLNASLTNTFYWTNIIHDITYQYGFDEASGNFQTNNYGNGGAAGDEVLGDVQDGSGTCNANFGTPGDGASPRMQMFVCGANDGSYDNLVIVHEYAHGISTRLTGGAGNSNSLFNQEQQGEGWSDYYGYMYTMSASNFNDDRAVGTFLTNAGPNDSGIRSFPYSTSMATNGQTYQDVINLGNGGGVAPHDVGEVWATMLYDLTQDLIEEYGFDADLYNGTGGNNISLALVTEGLKLQPASPGFVDSRDAILLADQLLFNGANQCIIWQSFANRGLGFSADQGSSALRADGTEAFDVPPISLTVSENDICLANGPVSLSGGIVSGGTYSGPGITDNGDGTTFTFDPVAAGIGTHTVTYQATDCSGNLANDTDTIIVTEVLPEISSCPDVTLTLGPDGLATYDPFSSGGLQVDIVGGNDGSNTQGFTLLFVPGASITATTTVSFDWELVTAGSDLPGFDSFVYLLDDTVFTISPDVDPIESGTFSIEVPAGQNFGFGISTADNTFGAATATVTNFSPGYSGQFDTGNWQEFNQSADGTAVFNGTAAPSLVSCGEVTTTLSQSVFTCLDIGTTTAVTVTITDSLGNTDTCSANVTVTGGALNTTTFTNGAWDNQDPTGTSMAIINDNYDTALLGDINACSCNVQNGNILTVRDDNFLNVAGNITVDAGGTLIVENAASVVQLDENAITTNNGTIEVRKTTPLLGGRDFTVLSSPMSAETRNGVLASADRVFRIIPSLFTPHPDVTTAINFIDQDFDYFSPATDLEIGRGHLVFPQHWSVINNTVALDHTYTQGTLNSGTINYPLEYNGPTTENNLNLVGNPYPSALDTDLLISTNDAIDQIFYWEHLTAPSADNPGDNTVNHSMDDVSIYNLTGGVAAVNGGTAPGRYMVSGQGFAVIANQAELGAPLTFTNAMRVTNNNGTVRSAENSISNKIWLRLSNENYKMASTALIGFMEEATPDFDSGYDAKRIESSVSLYSQHTDDQQLSIQAREAFNADIEVQLGFETKIEEHSNYSISIEHLIGQELTDTDVFLKDNLLDITVNLKEEDYTFSANPGNNPDRFTLRFNEETTLSTEDITTSDEISLYPNPTNSAITLSYRGATPLLEAVVIDVNGKLVKRVDLSNFENNQVFDVSTLATGMYFMQIEMQDTVVTRKILIN